MKYNRAIWDVVDTFRNSMMDNLEPAEDKAIRDLLEAEGYNTLVNLAEMYDLNVKGSEDEEIIIDSIMGRMWKKGSTVGTLLVDLELARDDEEMDKNAVAAHQSTMNMLINQMGDKVIGDLNKKQRDALLVFLEGVEEGYLILIASQYEIDWSDPSTLAEDILEGCGSDTVRKFVQELASDFPKYFDTGWSKQEGDIEFVSCRSCEELFEPGELEDGTCASCISEEECEKDVKTKILIRRRWGSAERMLNLYLDAEIKILKDPCFETFQERDAIKNDVLVLMKEEI